MNPNPIEKRLERIEVDEPVDIPNADGTAIAQTITVKVPAWRDPKDGEVYLDADSIAAIDKAKARHFGVLAPQELATLRRRLGATQKDIGEALQIGEKTWSRWETGRERPSRSMNLLLMALNEGKIDLAYLRCKEAAKSEPAPQVLMRFFPPALLASGYSQWTMRGTIHMQGSTTIATALTDLQRAASANLLLASREHVRVAMSATSNLTGNTERSPFAA